MSFFKKLMDQFTGKPVDWDDLEEMLVRADIGIPMMTRITDRLREKDSDGRGLTAGTAAEVAREEISRILPRRQDQLEPLPTRPKVILMVGVNGTGKTTSTAKLAHQLTQRNHSVLMVAADTFRAAAIEQLELWSERTGIEMMKGQYGGDPAALCYDAWAGADRRGIEFVICDTAGRLHTKHNLMEELSKIRRVLKKHDEDAPHEVLLVVDATTGGNALVQAKEFNKHMELTGVIVTKLDGSGKGGVLVAIQQELGIPCRYIGLGEKLEDLEPFDPDKFVQEVM
jgi:fused signal recognition particle receptor